MIKFGMWSTLLLVASGHGLIVASLLAASRRNRLANRFLAALLVGVVLMITPYTIGYAGFYDAYPWLTFAPFYWQLAFGPSLYFYVRQLGAVGLPRAWGWHYLPAAIQGAYYLVAFCLPLPSKWQWNDHGHEQWVMPVQNLLVLLSLAVYWWRAMACYGAYQSWLEANSSQREELRLGWLRGFLWAVAWIVAMNVAFQAVDALLVPLDYFAYFPFYVALSGLVYYLGIEGWRHAAIDFPTMDTPRHADAEPLPSLASDERAGRDWHAVATAWAGRVASEQWWREPALSAAELARRLGTNGNYLSRGLNDGLGQSFSEFINRQRVAEAQRRLIAEDSVEILALALQVGFGSKASFNRAFRAVTGTTPTAWRLQSMRSKS